MEYRYLFLKKGDKVFICHVGNRSIEFLKYKGELSFNASDAYFEIWKKKVGHNDEVVDICFLSDGEIPEELSSFIMIEESSFTQDIVKDCVLEILQSEFEFSFKDDNLRVGINNNYTDYKCNLSFEERVEYFSRPKIEKVVPKFNHKEKSLGEYYSNKTKEYQNK